MHTTAHTDDVARLRTDSVPRTAMPASQVDTSLANGHDGHHHSPPVAGKRAKGKKAMDSNEASRLLQARISQLEQDAAGEKDQELEIGA